MLVNFQHELTYDFPSVTAPDPEHCEDVQPATFILNTKLWTCSIGENTNIKLYFQYQILFPTENVCFGVG